MEDRFVTGDQVIRDDAPVTAPPDGFRAHHRAAALASKLNQPIEARTKAC